MTESRTLCVSGRRYFHQFRVKAIDMKCDLLAWLNSQSLLPKTFWHGRDGFEVAACGRALMLNSPPQFDAGNDSPAYFWGGHSFFQDKAPKDHLWTGFPRSAFFIPKIELIRKGNTLTLIQHAINAPLEGEIDLTPNYFQGGQISLEGAFHLPHQGAWHSLIKEALGNLRENLFQKVVLARRSTHQLQETPNPLEMLSAMKSGIRFAIQFAEGAAFIGATPERLYLREGLDLYTEAIGGTCRINEPESTLLRSEKDLLEFELIKISIQKSLEPLCQTLCCEKIDRILSTPKVRHLHNPFTGKLKKGIHDEEILQALHPTAAMGGLPKKNALEYLEKNEPFERGWYASPIGYISEHKTEFCVGIRSALVENQHVHLFAGTGIVDGSDPQKEWEELESKTSLWRQL